MKKTLKLDVIIGVGIILLIYFLHHPLRYQINYFRQLGIGQVHLYDSIIENKGEPLSIQQNEEGQWNVCYDGLEIKYGKHLETGIFECVTITGKQYKFGLWKIGIGTSREKIESVYRHIRKIKDLPDNEFGAIDGDTWVWFKFDANNNVCQIDLTDGI